MPSTKESKKANVSQVEKAKDYFFSVLIIVFALVVLIQIIELATLILS